MNRAQRRQQAREMPQVGDKVSNNGASYRYSEVGPEQSLFVRDWGTGDDETKMTSTKIIKEKVDVGVLNIQSNTRAIKKSPGINGLKPEKNDVFFLVGAGGSLRKHISRLPELHKFGTVFATNRALSLFRGIEECLDYAFLLDPKSFLFVDEDWWDELDRKRIDCVAGYCTHPTALDFNNHYFFGQAVGQVEEWEREIEKQGIDKKRTGSLDSGMCALYSNLHLCFKLNPKATVVLLGHDFSFVDYYKYFDRKFDMNDEGENIKKWPKEFGFMVTKDINGKMINTQYFLERQARTIAMALRNMKDAGGRIINATEGGILFDDYAIENISLVDYLWGGGK